MFTYSGAEAGKQLLRETRQERGRQKEREIVQDALQEEREERF